MVLWWCRMKPSNLRCLSHQIRRSYFQVSVYRSGNYALPGALVRAPSKPDLFLPKGPSEFACSSRFLSAKAKRKPKPKIKEEHTVRTNDEITAEVVRIIVREGDFTENTIVSRCEALERARKLNLDLVEVQPTGKPPVCRFMDFHKEIYKKQVFEKERAKSKSMQPTLRVGGELKNVRFTEKIDINDLKNKANMVKRLMEQGYRVKCSVLRSKLTRAEENEEEEVKQAKEEKKVQALKKMLASFIELINDISFVEGEASVESSQVYIVVRHRMFGPGKKSGKKDSVSSQDKSTSSSTRPKLKMDEISDENRNAWAVSEANDDFDEVFDLGDDGHATSSSRDQEKGDVAKAPLPSDVIENRYKRSEQNKQPTVIDNRYKRSEPNKPPTVTDNRYNRSEPNKQPTVTDNRYNRSEPNKQPTGADSAIFRNPRPPTGTLSQSPFHPRKQAPNEIPRHSLQQPPHQPTHHSSPVSSHNRYSAKKPDAAGRHEMAAEANRNRGGYPTDISKTPKSDDGQRSGANKGGTGKWGAFNGDGAKATSNRTSR